MKILIACNETLFHKDYLSLNSCRHYRLPAAGKFKRVLTELENDSSPHIVILDSSASSERLAELCARLRLLPDAERHYLIVVFENDRQAELTECLQAGADDYLLKPFDSEQITGRIEVAASALANRNSKFPVSDSRFGGDSESFQSQTLISKEALPKVIAAAVQESNVSMVLTTAQIDFPGPKIIFVNSGFSRMTGYSPSEVIGEPPRILQGVQANREVLEKLRNGLEKGEIFSGATLDYRKDGTVYDLEWQISPVRNETGEITNFFSIQHDVSRYKKNEHLLRESVQYQQLFNLVNDPVIVFDPATLEVLTVNNKACEVYRLPRETFIGQFLNRFWQDDSHEKEMISKLLADGVFEEFETVHYRSDGDVMHVLINSSLVEYENRLAVLSIKRDITERRRAEQNILRAKQEWSDTVDAVSDMIILEDPDGNLRRCNRATQRHFNLVYPELIGKPIAELIRRTKPDTAERQSNRDLVPGEHLRQSRWEGQLFDGHYWYEITNHALPTDDSGNVSWVHVIKNITERRRAEAETQRLYTAIEQAADAVLITNLIGLIQYVNASFERVTGWSREEAVGRGISEVKKSLDEYEAIEEIFSALRRSETWQKTYRALRKNGEAFDEQANISLVRDADGNPLNYVFVCRDVTEARRLESIAEAVNMMDNVGYIFSGIRHELGNPINSVKTALTVLRNNLEQWQPEQIKTYVERSLLETARVEYLLRALKTFSMHENPRVEPVQLNEYIENFVALIKEDFSRRGISVRTVLGANVGLGLCDPRALHQVMLNLLANAADAFKECRSPVIEIKTARLKNRIYITTEDNGSGMNEAQLDNLFKPFYTSKSHGTGLGLVIVRKMIVKMNGTIAIESQPNRGTKVKFTLEAVPKK